MQRGGGGSGGRQGDRGASGVLFRLVLQSASMQARVGPCAAASAVKPPARRPQPRQLRAQADPTAMRSSAARRLAAALAQRWGAAEPAAAGAAGGRGAPACRALYHRHNPWNMKVEREDGEELPGVQNLELSMDEMDEHKWVAEGGGCLEGNSCRCLGFCRSCALSCTGLCSAALGH